MVKRKTRRGSPLHLTGAFDLFKPSKEIILKNIWIFGPLYAIPLIFALHTWIWSPLPHTGNNWSYKADSFSSGWSFGPTPSYALSAFIGFSILWLLIVIIGGTIVKIMSQSAQLEGSEGKDLHFYRLWKVVKELGWRMLGLYFVMGLYIIVGFILLIVPGLIMIRRYFLAPYVMLDRKCGIKEAMERSAAMTKPSGSSDWTIFSRGIWGIIGVSILISLLHIIPFIGTLVAFVVGMLYSVAPALRYQELKKIS